MMLRNAILSTFAVMTLSATGLADRLYYDNGSFVTGVGTGPNGADVSVTETGTAVSLGFRENGTTPLRVADDFTVAGAPAGGVRLSRMDLFGVQRSTAGTIPQFAAAYVAIYGSDPAAGGTLLYGDHSTNRLVSTGFTGVYRLGTNGANAIDRPIIRVTADMSWVPPLADGTYWLVMSVAPDPAISGLNPHTILVTPHVGTNAHQLFNGNWISIFDVPFRLYEKCPADHNGMGDVELLDIFDFLEDWFANVPAADFNGMSGVDLLDIFAFLGAWFAGC
jgi:hypothetical protein